MYRSGLGLEWGREMRNGNGECERVCDMSGEIILDRGGEGGWEGV